MKKGDLFGSPLVFCGLTLWESWTHERQKYSLGNAGAKAISHEVRRLFPGLALGVMEPAWLNTYK